MSAIQELEERYSSGVYAKRGVTIVRGEGTRLWDEQGKEYIDCAAGMGVASINGPFCPQADKSGNATSKEPAAVITTRRGTKLERRSNIA